MAYGIEIRKTAVSGSFYPEDKSGLFSQLKFFFDSGQKIENKGELKAIIVPHAGYIYSGQTAAWGYRQLPALNDPHFVLIGPAHYFQFKGIVASQSKLWETPLGLVKHQKPLTDEVITLDERAHNPEHSIEVQVPFLQYLLQDKFSISCFLTGFEIDYEKGAEYFIRNYPDSLIIISSDLSHYLSEEEAKKIDRETINAILNFDFEYIRKSENIACGANGILILMEMAKKLGWKANEIRYDTSATATGETDKVVGYVSIGFYKV